MDPPTRHCVLKYMDGKDVKIHFNIDEHHPISYIYWYITRVPLYIDNVEHMPVKNSSHRLHAYLNKDAF